ncbi:Manganese transport system ATP-binding protein MntB [Commensalibacter sp. Nvir]|uniref:metal ABC transporter ATP-binding protein n=1 Tax=Commensalibacter sp. Nvir TaxID=3069817 RepID=UPI002D6C3F40|nr:Manganese transport system ATP-binding protein MntB [Commensalibacter sp. Nvir]
MNVIECHDLDIKRGSKLILSQLNLEIGKNQFIGIFGPNGSGKTTFIKTIMGIIPIHQGQLNVFGLSPSKARQFIGYIPQARDINTFRLTGRNFLSAGIRGYKFGLPFLNKQDSSRIDEALDQLQAKKLAEKPLEELSGGQRQRLLLAQALIENPKLIILDEPFSNLDPKWTLSILNSIKTIQRQRSLSVLLATHDLNPLLPIIDYVLCIGNKRAVLGTIDSIMTSSVLSDLYEFPLNVIRTKENLFVIPSF